MSELSGFAPIPVASVNDIVTGLGASRYNAKILSAQADQAQQQQQAATDLAQQQAQGETLKNQQIQRAMRDAEIYRQVWARNTDPSQFPRELAQATDAQGNKISGVGFSAGLGDYVKTGTGYAVMTKDQLANAKEQNTELAQQLSGVDALPEGQAQQDAWKAIQPKLAGNPHARGFDLSGPYDKTTSTALQNALGYGATLADQRLKRTEETKNISAAGASEASAAKSRAETPGAVAKSDIEKARAASLIKMTDADWQARLDATVPNKQTALYARTKAAVDSYRRGGDYEKAQAAIDKAGEQLGHTEQAVATEEATLPGKIKAATAMGTAMNPIRAQAEAQRLAAAAEAAGVTEDDYRRAGEQFAISGEMPQLGRDAFSRNKILHYQQEYARTSGMTPRDLAVAKAAFKGDSASLSKFQTQRDQVVSFEQTAQKNLDQFLDLASKIPDTGVPWLNTPIRLLDEKLVGSANMAAINAARTVANNEIAKVTSGGSMSAVLSDSARHEVRDYNPRDATFAQTKAVAVVLKRDMANRHASMDDTLANIKGRMAGGTPPAPSVPHETAPAAAQMRKYSPSTKKYYESADGGKTWAVAP